MTDVAARSGHETEHPTPPTSGRSLDDVPWIENRSLSSWFPRLDLRELWASRDVTRALALRNIKSRYKQTLLGVAWTVLQPLSAVVIFTLVFGRLAEVPSDGIPYPVFVYAGLAVWLYVSGAANLASESLAQYRELVTKVYFPRLHAPLAAVLPGLIDLGISLVAVAAFMAFYGVAPTAALVTLPLWIVAAVLLALAVGIWLAALNVRYRDVRNVLAFALQLWLFVTPVLYASSLLEGKWTWVLALNPLAGLVVGFRWALVGTDVPGVWALGSLAIGLSVLVSGIVYFARVQRRFADLI
jgi:lipopolysaccharide transport system permease protein